METKTLSELRLELSLELINKYKEIIKIEDIMKQLVPNKNNEEYMSELVKTYKAATRSYYSSDYIDDAKLKENLVNLDFFKNLENNLNIDPEDLVQLEELTDCNSYDLANACLPDERQDERQDERHDNHYYEYMNPSGSGIDLTSCEFCNKQFNDKEDRINLRKLVLKNILIKDIKNNIIGDIKKIINKEAKRREQEENQNRRLQEERERERERESNREIERESNREIERESNRERERESNREEANNKNKQRRNITGEIMFAQRAAAAAANQQGGSINLTSQQSKHLIQQIGGKSIKSTYVTYNGSNAKIIGLNKQTLKLVVQTGSGLENISVYNLHVNGKKLFNH